jgi:hypothetical protein
VDQQRVAQVEAVLALQTARCSETKREADQKLDGVQSMLDEAQRVLAHWQAESVKANQWVATARQRLQHAEEGHAHAIDALVKVDEEVEQASDEDETTKQTLQVRSQAAKEQVSIAETEMHHAERELSNALTHANDCTYAVNYVHEAVQIAAEAQEYARQGINALGRSVEYVVAVQKALEEGKMALGREEEAIRATEEVLKIAKATRGEASDSLHSALIHEQCSQEYQAQARVILDGKILALVALNQSDFNFMYGGALVDQSPFNLTATGDANGVRTMLPGYSLSPLADSSTALSKKSYAGPQSDPELRLLIEHLSRREGLTPEHWSNLQEGQRHELLRNVHTDIAQAYGFAPYPIEARFLPIESRGSFSAVDKKIVINRRLLAKDNPKQALTTLAHESRHAYQHHAINQPLWMIPVDRRDTVRSWKENWDDYKAPGRVFEDYYKQPVEVDARAFADEVVRRLYGGKQ